LSQYYSAEQFAVEITKLLNLVFRFFDFNVILNACPERDIMSPNQIMYNWAKKSKTPLLTEWSLYSLTSMYIRILSSIQLDNTTEILFNIMDQCSHEVLMMLLQHQQNVTVKSLIHKTFRNIIQILETINQ
jgi:hypothetical protein